MYGDVGRIRARATQLRDAAGELRSRASSMRAQAEACAWSSRSGELLRSRVGSVAGELGGHAARLDDAAVALETHARGVERALSRIEAARTIGEGVRESEDHR